MKTWPQKEGIATEKFSKTDLPFKLKTWPQKEGIATDLRVPSRQVLYWRLDLKKKGLRPIAGIGFSIISIEDLTSKRRDCDYTSASELVKNVLIEDLTSKRRDCDAVRHGIKIFIKHWRLDLKKKGLRRKNYSNFTIGLIEDLTSKRRDCDFLVLLHNSFLFFHWRLDLKKKGLRHRITQNFKFCISLKTWPQKEGIATVRLS